MAASGDFDPGLARELYRHMLRLRRLDERCLFLQRQGRIGFFGSALGQEAVVVGAALAIAREDWIFPALRESGAMLVRGYPLTSYVAQLFGCALDPMHGRQMPSHMASRSVNQVSWSSAIATQLPHAVGAAWASKHLGESRVMLAFLGDGATSHPDFHGALNLAGLWRAPVVFVCQNNQYALSVPATRQTASQNFAIKAAAYGFGGEVIDGNDALCVHRRVKAAVEKARAGQGPHFIECVTYRLGPHSSSDDPSLYRSDAEVETWRAKNPILGLRRELEGFENRALGDVEAKELVDFDAELDQAIALAEAAPSPPLESLFQDVYQKMPFHLRDQAQSLKALGATGLRQ